MSYWGGGLKQGKKITIPADFDSMVWSCSKIKAEHQGHPSIQMEMWDKVHWNFFQLKKKIRFSYCTFKPSLTRIKPEAFKKLTESSLLNSDIWRDKKLSGAFQDLYNRFKNTNDND